MVSFECTYLWQILGGWILQPFCLKKVLTSEFITQEITAAVFKKEIIKMIFILTPDGTSVFKREELVCI